MTEPLVLLPGHMCDVRLFHNQISVLGGRATLHFPCVSDRDSIEGMALDTLADAPPKFAVAGLSMGGLVALEIFRIAPGRVTRIALMDTNHLAETDEAGEARRARESWVRAHGLREVVRDDLKPRYKLQSTEDVPVSQLVMEMALSIGQEVFFRQSQAIGGRRDQTETLRSIDVPTSVICGEFDAVCPVETHRDIACLIPDSRLEVIPEAGHLPTLEQPEVTNRKLIEWMEIKA